MDTRLKTLLLVNSNNLGDRTRLLDDLTNGMFQIMQSLHDANVKIKYHQSELESKIFRFGMANHSIIQLLKGTKFNILHLETSKIDLFSIYSIMRLQIESFIILFYLVFDSVKDQEKDFRYNIYRLHGLLKQSGNEARSDATALLKKQILKDIEEIRSNIKASPQFKSASETEKRKFLEPRKPKLVEPKELFSKSGIKQIRFLDVWNLYSNYAHAEHISDRQYNHYFRNNETLDDALNSVLNQCSQLTTRLILLLSGTFSVAKNTLEILPEEVKVQIEIWEEIKEHKSKKYNK